MNRTDEVGKEDAYVVQPPTSTNLLDIHNLTNGDIKTSKKSLPHKKRIPQKLKAPSTPGGAGRKGSRSQSRTQPKEEEVVGEVNCGFKSHQFVCDICHTQVPNQFQFFAHLKSHYETPPGISDFQAASILVEASVASTNSTKLTSQTPLETGEEWPESGDEEAGIKSPIRREEGEALPSTSSFGSDRVVDLPEKITILSCPKCRRNFRRERTFQAHVESCEKTEAADVGKAKPKNKRIRSLKLECVEMVAEDPIDSQEDDPLEDIIELEQDPLHVDPADLVAYDGEEVGDALLTEGNLCPSCEDIFPSSLKLDLHIKKAHPELAATIKSMVRASTKGGKKLGVAKKQEDLQCSECSRVFNHRNSLIYHMRSHTGERPHQCDMCGKSFFATSALKVHMRLHSGEKPYKCEHCGRHFRQWGDLKYHVISIHSDIRQYQCEFCGKDFARKYSLIVHRRIHTGERNYKCEFCNKCFRAASYLQNHRRIHTGEKPHACNICGKPFRVRSDMKRHMASHTRDHGHVQQHVPPVILPKTIASSSATSSASDFQSQQQQQTVVSVASNPANQLLAAVGPQMSQQLVQAVRQTMQNAGSATGHLVQQQVNLDDSIEAIISGDINDGAPINITLSQGQRGSETATLNAATVATLQATDLPEGVIYQTQDGQMEAVTIRESSTGALYVFPVYMQ